MEASSHDLDVLQKIQAVDLEIRKLRKTLDALPQREAIVAIRDKKSAIEAQNERIVKLKSQSSHKLARLQDEDASLAKKESGVQAALEAAHGDFRNVSVRSRELENLTRRRESLAEQTESVRAELQQLDALSQKVSQTLEDLNAQENEQIESFRTEGGELKSSIAALEAQRSAMTSTVDASLLKIYEKTAAQTGGVAIGKLEGSRCGICHVPMEQGRLIAVRAEAPLGQCPSCKRLLIIEPVEEA